MAAESTMDTRVFGLKLWQQVLIGLVLGVAVGFYLEEQAPAMKIFGTVFLTLIKMLVSPLIFLALLSGVTSMADSHNFTRVGLRGLTAYLLTAMTAVVLGIVAGIVFQPGVGVHIDLAALSSEAAIASASAKAPPTIGEFLLNLIPHNIFKAMSDDHYLQIIGFAIFTGITMNTMGKKAQRAREFIYDFAQVVFRMIEYVVRLAPLAVFGFMAWMVSTQGLGIIVTLGKLVLAVIAACLVQYVIFGLILMIFGRLNPLPFYKKMITTQTLAFSTSSSKATLSTAMRELNQKLGVSEGSTNFLLPLGACINMDGTAIYLGICALFFSQLFNVPLGPHDYAMLILTCTLGSIGAAGIPSGSIIFMGMVLSSVGLPLEGIGIILGVDRLLDMLRTTINITGDSTITLLIDRTEGQLDEKKYYAKLK